MNAEEYQRYKDIDLGFDWRKLFLDIVSLIIIGGIALAFFLATRDYIRFSPSAPSLEPRAILPVSNPFSEVSLEAKAAYVFDAKTGKELYSLNSETLLPLASLTKIMTAITALSLVPEGMAITIDKKFLEEEGDSGFFVGESWDIKDLLGFTLVQSSNDGAGALASVAGAWKEGAPVPYESSRKEFIEKMNEEAKSLGLYSMYFLNETGLDIGEDLSGGYGSAKDVSNLFARAVKSYPEVFEDTRYGEVKIESLDGKTHIVKNTNSSVDKIPMLIASKTGYTDLAGGNLAIAWNAGFDHPIIVTVLGSTYEGRFTDVEKLVKATLEYLKI